MVKKSFLFSALLCCSFLTVRCSTSENSGNGPTSEVSSPVAPINPVSDSNQKEPQNPVDQSSTETAAQVLLFNGYGISYSDWKSTEQIVQSMGLTYRLINSSQLTAMTLTELKQFKLIIVPGGNSNTIDSNLSTTTKIKVRQAVRDGGVNFLGFCAGAFAAVGIDSLSNTTAYYGFAVAQGDYLKHWYPNNDSTQVTSVQNISFADGTRRYMIWWDGPATPAWYGGVIARYPDGKPAISQTKTGLGFVIVSGIHPEAPASWQWDSGKDPDGTDFDIAAKLIRAAMNKTPLAAY